jgi:alpha-beta hydrolase superfamily lysophospholipase
VIRELTLGAAAASWLATAPAFAGFLESPRAEMIEVPTRPGVSERYALWKPDAAPKAIALLFIGGDGAANIRDNMPTTYAERGNFLTRSREWFRRRGFAVAAVDSPSDHTGGMVAGFRLTSEHATDIGAVMADLRRRIPGVPVWAVGTSRGTISAASVASRLQGPAGPDGVVLTSSVSRIPGPGASSRDHVLDVNLAAIRVPVLIVYHRGDSCRVVSVADGGEIQRKLTSSPRTELLMFDGGDPPQSGPCDPLAPHGYFGIEEKVVGAIADWILGGKSAAIAGGSRPS